MKLITFLLIASIFALTSSILGAAIEFGHYADQVKITVNGQEQTLQEAISYNQFTSLATHGGCNPSQCFSGVNSDGTPKCVEIITYDIDDFKKGTPQISTQSKPTLHVFEN